MCLSEGEKMTGYTQDGFKIRLEWGMQALEALHETIDCAIVVLSWASPHGAVAFVTARPPRVPVPTLRAFDHSLR